MSQENTSTGPWRARPVFISSTFKDMQAERDWLRHHVFDRVEEELRKRRQHLEPIDLRIRVETAQAGSEEARELLVLKVCLDEIKRSRPLPRRHLGKMLRLDRKFRGDRPGTVAARTISSSRTQWWKTITVAAK